MEGGHELPKVTLAIGTFGMSTQYQLWHRLPAHQHIPVSGLPTEQWPKVEHTRAHDILLEDDVIVCFALPSVRKHHPRREKMGR